MDRNLLHDGIAAGAPGVLAIAFAVLGPPVLWSAHLLAAYLLVTLDCLTAWGRGTGTVLAVTALAAGGSGSAGWLAWRGLRRLAGRAAGDGEGDPEDWAGFLLRVGLAGALLFTLVIVATGIVPLFVPLCAGP